MTDGIDTGADQAVKAAILDQIERDDFGGSSFFHDCAADSMAPWLEHDPTCRGRCFAALSASSGAGRGRSDG